MTDSEIPGWDGCRRQDGALVLVTEQATWAILVPDRPLRLTCPCCDKPFHNARAAKLTADKLYPEVKQETAG